MKDKKHNNVIKTLKIIFRDLHIEESNVELNESTT